MRRALDCTFILLLFALFCAVPGASAEPAPEHEFAGAKKCSLCHKTEKHGEQFPKWQSGPHARAFETLGTPEAKEVAAKMGIEDPQQSGKCLKCHSTAYYFSEERVSDAIAVEESVSCESCHGPGKDYMKKSIMEDREKAVESGLQIAGEQTCARCHNEESPTFKPFDFAERWEKIKHPVPNK